jgi:hypothetical protein
MVGCLEVRSFSVSSGNKVFFFSPLFFLKKKGGVGFLSTEVFITVRRKQVDFFPSFPRGGHKVISSIQAYVGGEK